MRRKYKWVVLILSLMLVLEGCSTTKLDGDGSSGQAIASNDWIEEESNEADQAGDSSQQTDKDSTQSQNTTKQNSETSSDSNKRKDTTSGQDETKDTSDTTDHKDTSSTTVSKADTSTTDSSKNKKDPVDPEDATVNKKEKLTCTITINCSTVLDHWDSLDESKQSIIPEDGVILKKTKVTFYKGESVYDVLKGITKTKKIQMEAVFTPVYNSAYIEGIDNLYEFDCGELSGWMFSVNEWYPNYGCARYQLEDGDEIQWNYTCDLGRDLGQEGVAQQ